MHTKIAEPHPIFNKDKNKSNAKANLFTFYNRGKEPKKYNLIYFRNNIVKSFFIHIFILKLFFNQKMLYDELCFHEVFPGRIDFDSHALCM